ncbi:hypothetical protein BU23DRAFT_313738 [Bimuria novae-zelandiae CBS 107.79]|uniref:Ig-like domain-containing protein n=1 Tax=Bimuria novae-zelandiae CBS 107.79 TaxID=1447943 RepID=A0A6A5USI3_9PLEO|nr:hypothetical protein BU23DRAFT_313738 [Bimuria novae-zelandiae CBS 107.79]
MRPHHFLITTLLPAYILLSTSLSSLSHPHPNLQLYPAQVNSRSSKMFSRSTHPHRWDLGPADLPAPPASRPNTPADVYSATVTPHVLPPNDPSRKGSPTFPNLYMAPSIPLRGYASIIATLCTLPTISLIAQFARGTAPITHPAASKTGVQVLKLGIIPKSFRCANEHFSMSLEWVDEHWYVYDDLGL